MKFRVSQYERAQGVSPAFFARIVRQMPDAHVYGNVTDYSYSRPRMECTGHYRGRSLRLSAPWSSRLSRLRRFVRRSLSSAVSRVA